MTIFDSTHDMFRQSFRSFLESTILPQVPRFEKKGIVDRSIYTEAARHGFIGYSVPVAYGGLGIEDFRFNAIVNQEIAAVGAGAGVMSLAVQNDVTTPCLVRHCNREQAARWLPGIASGKTVSAIAMTEPDAGSDLSGIRTTARRDGSDYVLSGTKTFISQGINSDLVIVVCSTDPGAGKHGLSLLVVERGMKGFERGKTLEKIGQHSADTAELFFSDVRVPTANLLGEEGRAFEYLGANLAQERLSTAIYGHAVAKAALRWTIDYVKERKAFGRTIAEFQNTRFTLAELSTEIELLEPALERAICELNEGALTAVKAAMLKLHATELQKRTVDRCLQFFGGNGYMREFPIARAYVDSRPATIYVGTSEIMKTIIAREILG